MLLWESFMEAEGKNFFSTCVVGGNWNLLLIPKSNLQLKLHIQFLQEFLTFLKDRIFLFSFSHPIIENLNAAQTLICKVWLATLIWVARTHLTRPYLGAHAHVWALVHLQFEVVALRTRTFGRLPFFQQFFNLFQQFFNIFRVF